MPWTYDVLVEIFVLPVVLSRRRILVQRPHPRQTCIYRSSRRSLRGRQCAPHKLTTVVQPTQRHLALLPARRSMGRLYAMVNPQASDDSRCGSMSARAALSHTASDSALHDTSTRTTQAGGQLGGQPGAGLLDREVDGASRTLVQQASFPASPSTDTHSVSSSSSPSLSSPSDTDAAVDEPHSTLLSGQPGQCYKELGEPWSLAAREAVKELRVRGDGTHFDRISIYGDGSCARGALALALASVTSETQSLYGLPVAVSTNGRNHSAVSAVGDRVIGYVGLLTPEQWGRLMPKALRDDVWADRTIHECRNAPPCNICAERSLANEQHLFLDVYKATTAAVPPAWFFMAALALHIGVLLLVHDTRSPYCTVRQLHDFGTEAYPWSVMIIQVASSGSKSVGHYESVGLRLPSASRPMGLASHRTHQLLFPRDSPLLEALRNYALDPKVLQWASIWLHSYGAWPGPQNIDLRNADAEPNALPNNSMLLSRTGMPPATLPYVPLAATDAAFHNVTLQNLPAVSSELRESDKVRQSHRQRRTASRLVAEIGASPPVQASKRKPRRSATDAPDTAARTPQSGSKSIRRIRSIAAGVRSLLGTSRCSTLALAQPDSAPVRAAPACVISNRLSQTSARILCKMRRLTTEAVQRGRLAKKIYHTNIPLWINQCKKVLLPLAASLRQQPMLEPTVAQWVTALLMLPNEVFTIPSRTGGGARKRKAGRQRLRHRLSDAGLVPRVFARAAVDCQDAPDEQRDVPSQPDRWWPRDYITTESDSDSDSESASTAAERRSAGAPDASAARAGDARAGGQERDPDAVATLRAQQHLSRGHMRRALQSIASVTELADLDIAAERERLRQLHPSPAESDQAMPRCPEDAPKMVVHPEWMAKEMHASDTGASPGPSGWGYNYLSVLAGDKDCVQALATFIEHIVNNTLPAAVRELLTTSYVVSLEKPESDGRRPIAIGDMFVRLAAHFALCLVSTAAQDAMRPSQFGAGQPDGATQIVQSVQHLSTLR